MLGVAPFAAAPFAALAGGDVTVAITGNAASGAVGNITSVTAAVAVYGVASTLSVGSVVPKLAVELSGVEATGAVGDLSYSQEITGVESAGQVGDVAVEPAFDLVGVEATGGVTQTFPELEIALTGVEAVGGVGDVEATQVIEGVEATGEVGDVALGDREIEITGVEAAVEQGDMVATQILDGVELTGAVGDLGIGDREIALTGVETACQVGDISYSQGIQPDIAVGQVGTPVAFSSVAITGNQTSGAVGSLIPGFQIDGVSAAGQVGIVALGDRQIAISGVASTTAVGTVTFTLSQPLTGVQAAGSVGTVEFSYVADGQVAYGQVGYMLPVHTVELLEGWGALGWGVEPWGGTAGANQINTAVGDVVGGQQLGPGVSATGGVGSVTPGVIPYPEGDVAYGQVGSVGNVHAVALNTEDVLGWGLGPWSGDTSSGGYYDIAWGGVQTHNPAVAYGNTGTVVPTPLIPLTGVETTGQVGQLGVLHTNALTGVEAAVQAGTVYPIIYAALTGVQATGYVGTMGVIHSNPLTGVEAVGIVGNVCVGNWTIIDTSQDAAWQAITTAQSSSWQTIDTTQNADWDLVVTEEC